MICPRLAAPRRLRSEARRHDVLGRIANVTWVHAPRFATQSLRGAAKRIPDPLLRGFDDRGHRAFAALDRGVGAVGVDLFLLEFGMFFRRR